MTNDDEGNWIGITILMRVISWYYLCGKMAAEHFFYKAGPHDIRCEAWSLDRLPAWNMAVVLVLSIRPTLCPNQEQLACGQRTLHLKRLEQSKWSHQKYVVWNKARKLWKESVRHLLASCRWHAIASTWGPIKRGAPLRDLVGCQRTSLSRR